MNQSSEAEMLELAAVIIKSRHCGYSEFYTKGCQSVAHTYREIFVEFCRVANDTWIGDYSK